MRVSGVSYKSLNFTILEDKLRAKEKIQTYRIIFIAKYEIGETIAITFKKKLLYLATIQSFYPRMMRNITLKEALRDGFNSVEAMKEAIRQIHGKVSENQWGFITRFKAVPEILDYLDLTSSLILVSNCRCSYNILYHNHDHFVLFDILKIQHLQEWLS